MHKIMLVMRRDDLTDLPTYACPPNYRIRVLNPDVPADREAWVEIETAAGEFVEPGQARAAFVEWFAPNANGLTNRGFLLEL